VGGAQPPADRTQNLAKTRKHAMHLQAAFIGAVAIADLVKTTLGPKGMVRRRW
jgi:chaperonin GroEL (HSP60 family)